MATSAAESSTALAFVEACVGSLIDYLPAPLLITDSQGVIGRVNPAAERLLGSCGSMLVGTDVRSVLPFVGRPGLTHTAWAGDLPSAGRARLQVQCTSVGYPTVLFGLYVLHETDGAN